MTATPLAALLPAPLAPTHLAQAHADAPSALLAVAHSGGLIQHVDWLAITPPLAVAVTALAVLLADLFLPKDRKALLGPLTLLGLAVALLALIPLRDGHRTSFCLRATTAVATAPGPAAAPCSYVADHFALVFQLLALGGAFLAALLSVQAVADDRMPPGEFWFLLLSSACGAALLPACRDLASLVVALEVATLPAFALVGLRRDRRGGEAALTFFLSSVTATAVTLLGIGFVYAATGSVYLDRIAAALPHVDPQLKTLALVGSVLTLVGFAFKTAAAPFHFWVPDTYTGASVPVAAYLSVVGKAAGLSGLAAIAVLGFHPYGRTWGLALAVLAALTMTWGNVAALRQRPDTPGSAVRLLAWSSVAQAGYLLVPVAAAGFHPGPHPLGATLAYALIYGVANLGAFAVVAHGGRTLDDYRGLWSRRPAAALGLAFFLLSLAGLPPGVFGLFGKAVVFQSAVDSGLGWLAVIMAVNVVIALAYYLTWTAALFRTPDTPHPTPRPFPLATTVAATLATGLGLGLSVAPQLVLHLLDTPLFN